MEKEARGAHLDNPLFGRGGGENIRARATRSQDRGHGRWKEKENERQRPRLYESSSTAHSPQSHRALPIAHGGVGRVAGDRDSTNK